MILDFLVTQILICKGADKLTSMPKSNDELGIDVLNKNLLLSF